MPNSNVTMAERQVEVADPNAPTETCEQVTASPSAHVSAGGYCSTGGGDYLGAVPGGYAWAKETSDGVFEKGQCQ